MKKLICLLFMASLLVMLDSCGGGDDISASGLHFVTSDIDLFWQTYDQSDNPASVNYQSLYIDRGSAGLKDYAEQKDLASTLIPTLGNPNYRNYYDDIRANTLDLSDVISISEEAFYKLKEIHPATGSGTVYFLVGSMTAGGRISQNGLLIAVEMFSKNEDTDISQLSEWHQNVVRNKTFLPSIVIHEMIHMQQRFEPTSPSHRTLLEQSIMEGMADFISFHLLKDQPFMNHHLHTYGDAREEEIWKEFDRQKGHDFRETEWLYTGESTDTGHPADMGYYVGYKILESYSEQFENVETAISAMLSTSDYREIFEQSGYAEKFSRD